MCSEILRATHIDFSNLFSFTTSAQDFAELTNTKVLLKHQHKLLSMTKSKSLSPSTCDIIQILYICNYNATENKTYKIECKVRLQMFSILLEGVYVSFKIQTK